MPRPWLVQSWDGRLATTRRPFSFPEVARLQPPIAPAPVGFSSVQLPYGPGADHLVSLKVLGILQRLGHARGLGACVVRVMQHLGLQCHRRDSGTEFEPAVMRGDEVLKNPPLA